LLCNVDLIANPGISSLIAHYATTEDIHQAAIDEGMVPMTENALEKRVYEIGFP